MDADQDDVVFADLATDCIDTAGAFFERDVFNFGNEELCVVAVFLEGGDNHASDFTGVGVFEEEPIRRAFARSFDAVAIVNEDFHSCKK